MIKNIKNHYFYSVLIKWNREVMDVIFNFCLYAIIFSTQIIGEIEIEGNPSFETKVVFLFIRIVKSTIAFYLSGLVLY